MVEEMVPLTPNEELAKVVSEALVSEGLVVENQAEELTKKLISGNAREADWQRWIEEAIDVSKRVNASK